MRDVVSGVPLAASPFPQIADYAFLSDCEVNALVAPSGQVEWMCIPRMDSPSIFGAILDRDAGMFALAPAEARVPAGQRYIPGTNILETTWGTKTGWLIVRDVLLVGPWRHDRERSHTHRRSPTDYDAEHILLRTMRCVNGMVQVQMECDPIYDYGRAPAAWEYTGRAYEECSATFEGHDLKLQLHSDLRLGIEGSTVRSRTTMHDGDQAFVALSWSDHPAPATWDDAYSRLVRTADFWHEWIAQGEFPDHPWRRHLQRSALTLKGLVYAPTGAMCAAATTSLPETPGGERNWDYRFTWVRDSTFMLWALYTLGFDWEADDFFHFIAEACADADLQVMYGIGGERELDEFELDHLEGYEHSRPVRIGNAAYKHQQHDVWGSALDSFYLHTKTRDGLRETYWPMLCKQVEKALTHWREPDRGIWEVRGEPQHFTSSKIMCWVAADRGARLARLREDHEKAERWQAASDEIRADVLANAVDDRGVLTQHYGTNALDASLLLAPLVRFLPSDDERIVNTVNAIDRELTVHGLVLRYKVDQTDDGLAGEEGTFTICSFWLVSALSEIGENQRARDLCERLLSYASPLLLYGEELDPLSGRHLGNFPQAFTHLALINAAMHVIRADRRLAIEQQPLDSTRRER